MDRQDYYYGQYVEEDELDAGFAAAEVADRNLAADMALCPGVISGGAVTQHAPTPDLTVDVSGPLVSYDATGKRVQFTDVLQNADMSEDDLGVSTLPPSADHCRVVSLFGAFARAESDPRTDDDGNPVNFIQAESMEFSVVAGAEYEPPGEEPDYPPLDDDKVLLTDVILRHGCTEILNTDGGTEGYIDETRKQRAFAVTGTSYSLTGADAATARTAITKLIEYLDGRTKVASGTRTEAQAVANGADTNITLPAEDFDTDAMFTAGEGVMTVKTGGLWQVSGCLDWDANAVGSRKVTLVLNDSTVIGGQSCLAAGDGLDTYVCTHVILILATNDTIKLYGEQTSGESLDVLNARLVMRRIAPTPA